jgi:hypothetical protein
MHRPRIEAFAVMTKHRRQRSHVIVYLLAIKRDLNSRFASQLHHASIAGAGPAHLSRCTQTARVVPTYCFWKGNQWQRGRTAAGPKVVGSAPCGDHPQKHWRIVFQQVFGARRAECQQVCMRQIGEVELALSIARVNSKATLKVPLDVLLQHIPTALHHEIRASRHVAERANALIIQADDSRKQSDNAQNCYRRLYEAIVDAGRHAIPGETSAEQAQRVKNLSVGRVQLRPLLTAARQKSDNERRLKSKRTHSAKKCSRRGRGDD